MSANTLLEALVSAGFDANTAAIATMLSDSLLEASALCACAAEAKPRHREYFCCKHHRLYYHDTVEGGTSWELPAAVMMKEALTDMFLHSLTPKEALECCQVVQHVLESAPWPQVQSALKIALKLIGNIVDCGNSEERFRVVKCENAAISSRCLSVPHTHALLVLAGFREEGTGGTGVLRFCDEGVPNTAAALASRLSRVVDQRGHTGEAKTAADGKDAARATASRHHGTPGFQYQQLIYECGACERPINDGSDRLFTRSADAPRGEYRYACEQCPAYNLCESCWDRFQSGAQLHDTSHSFQHHPPRMQRHNNPQQASDVNPWGNAPRASVGRARDRLRERTGR